MTDFTILVGGEAGQGVQTVGFVLAKTFARAGLNVFADQDYESRIRGGHNFFRIRISDFKVHALSEAVKIVIALNAETADLHKGDLAPRGKIIVDTEKNPSLSNRKSIIGVPFERLAVEQANNKLLQNAVAAGSALGLTNCGFEVLEGVLRDQFSSAGKEAAEGNIKAARAGYSLVREESKPLAKIDPTGSSPQMLLNGNEALAIGALVAGCKFIAGYPMTPGTPILEYMASKSKELGLVMVQAEDEIAAVNMVVGAAFAGVRAMTATSGGGFSLMVEALGLAGMTETPIVIVDAQRGGPSTGLPTRTEQSDLEFVIHASQGEFPRIVLAPGTVDECFIMGASAFNLAERFQVPVIVLSDHHLASSYATTEKFDLSKIVIDRGELSGGDGTGPKEYKKYQFTDSGISPRAFPGLSEALVVTTGDEHDEEGHITEDIELRNGMMLKRLIKIEAMRNAAYAPTTYGEDAADLTLIGCGSTLGALKEAVDILGQQSVSANLVHFSQIWPFPQSKAVWLLSKARRIVAVENNATSQFAHLLRAETGLRADSSILRFDGRPLTPHYIVERLARR